MEEVHAQVYWAQAARSCSDLLVAVLAVVLLNKNIEEKRVLDISEGPN
jgi:hypothetical protein